MAAEDQAVTRYKRIEANCKKTWGAWKEFEIDIETDDWEYYSCVVREDLGDTFGPPLTMTYECDGEEAAWDELDRVLQLWVKSAESEQGVSQDDTVEIFGGRYGPYQNLIKTFLNKQNEKAALTAEK